MLLNILEKIANHYFAAIAREKPSLEAIQSTRLIAHRGAHHHAQGIIENTLAAFDRAKNLKCWGIEFDVHATADHVLVVHHDPTLKRLWRHTQPIANLRYSELKALAPEIPSLEKVVTLYGDSLHLFIELKTSVPNEDILIQNLQGLSSGTHYHLLTLDSTYFNSVSQVPKHALLLVAQHNNVTELCNLSLEKEYGGVLGHYLMITNKTIEKLKSAEQMVGVGMIDSKYSLYRELNRGIKWLFTNQAFEVQQELESLVKRDCS